MKIENAIEVLLDIHRSFSPSKGSDQRDAVKLGIEALKQVQENRTTNLDISYKPLPGETE